MATSSLQVDSGIVGTRSLPLEIEVTSRMIMNYAAGIGDSNPWHFADDRPEGIVAPPMMTWALTWQFSVQRQKYWGDSGVPREIGPRGVHYTEELEWTRPLCPGDKLTIEGEIVQLMSHRAGTYVKTRYVGVDASGERVFTEHVGGILRDVGCVGDIDDYASSAPGMDAVASREALRTVRLPIHPLAAHVYDGCANIHNPIHTSKAFAQGVGLPDIILHGTASLAYAVRDITDTEGGGNPCSVRRLCCSFTGMVFMDTEVELQILGSRDTDGLKEVFFQVIGQDGKKAIRDGCIAFKDS